MTNTNNNMNEPIKFDLTQLPVYQMMIANTDAEDTMAFDATQWEAIYKSLGGIEKNSLTTAPAIGLKAVMQSSGIRPLKLTKNADGTKRLITGIKQVPDMMLLKLDESGRPYADVYTKEVIYHSRNKFMMNGNVHAIDFEHTGPNLSDIYLVESWLVEDPNNDKLNALGFTDQFRAMGYGGIPVGTWAVTYFVPNDKLWNEIMTNPDGYGFSIMGYYMAQKQSPSAAEQLMMEAIKLSKRDDLSTESKMELLMAMMAKQDR